MDFNQKYSGGRWAHGTGHPAATAELLDIVADALAAIGRHWAPVAIDITAGACDLLAVAQGGPVLVRGGGSRADAQPSAAGRLAAAWDGQGWRRHNVPATEVASHGPLTLPRAQPHG